MTDFPYILKTGIVTKMLEHVQSAGKPDKVTREYLKKIGMTSSNDHRIISVFKFIGFLKESGESTEVWMAYRDKGKAKGVLANAIRNAYSDLFSTYPDAYRKDDEAIRNYFSAETDVGEKALKSMVNTFKVLCQSADFVAIAEGPPQKISPSKPSITEKEEISIEGATTKGVTTININIQLQLPATDDASVYDKLFEALKKHLLIK